MVRLNVSEDEKKFLIDELSQRIKDLAYMNARKRTEEALDTLLEKIKDRDTDPNALMEITLHYQFLINDLIQMLGRYKRMRGG
jgi:hypothetical protein